MEREIERLERELARLRVELDAMHQDCKNEMGKDVDPDKLGATLIFNKIDKLGERD
jgi:hypothetical protein